MRSEKARVKTGAMRLEGKTRFPVFVGAAVSALALACGCPSGPYVKTFPQTAGWEPGTVVMFPVVAADTALSAATGLPSDLAPPSRQRAEEEVTACLERALKGASAVRILRVSPETSGTELAVDMNALCMQYLNSLEVNPDLVVSLGRRIEADAVLLTALLRYGPEVEGDQQTVAQSAQTKVGASQLSISSTSPQTVVYLNCSLRCRLLRLRDAAPAWDVSAAERQKRVALLEITQESVLKKAVSDVAAVFPYARRSASRPPPP